MRDSYRRGLPGDSCYCQVPNWSWWLRLLRFSPYVSFASCTYNWNVWTTRLIDLGTSIGSQETIFVLACGTLNCSRCGNAEFLHEQFKTKLPTECMWCCLVQMNLLGLYRQRHQRNTSLYMHEKPYWRDWLLLQIELYLLSSECWFVGQSPVLCGFRPVLRFACESWHLFIYLFIYNSF